MDINIPKKTKKHYYRAIFAVLTFVSLLGTAQAKILFQDDNFATIDSGGLILNNNNNTAYNNNLTIQFGQNLGKTLTYSSTNSRFEINAGLDIGNNQLSTARIENVAALPGGTAGPGSESTGRIVQLTVKDTVAPGCTVSPNCGAGAYSWDGSTWHYMGAGPTPLTNTKIVTVGPSNRDYTTVAAAAAYLNSNVSGGEIWVDPGTYAVTSVVNLSNIKIRGADPSNLTIIDISGGGRLDVMTSKFEALTITMESSMTSSMGINALYDASVRNAVEFRQVTFNIASGKIGIDKNSTPKTKAVLTFDQCNETGAGILMTSIASSNLDTPNQSTGTYITVINLLTSNALKISDWPVTIIGGSNVVTTGIITTVPDRTILVSPGMGINDAITSLAANGGSGVVKLLVGTHNITSPIVLNNNNIKLVGEGPGTIINVPSSGWAGGTGGTVAAIQVGAANGTAPAHNVIISDLTIKVEPDIHGVKVNGGYENKVMDTVIQSTGIKSTTHTALVFTDSTTPNAAAGSRFTATRNIINRDDSSATPSCNTSGAHCWVDGVHFDGDASLPGQIFGYGNTITDSIISENIVNEVGQTCYAFSAVKGSGIFSNRARNIGFTETSPIGLFLANTNDVTVINNAIETNNNTSTKGILLYSNVQTSEIVNNTINSNGVANFNIGISMGSNTPSNDNIIMGNTINGITSASGSAGIYIGTGNLRNLVSHNQFINVPIKITDSGSYTRLESSNHQATTAPTANDDITRGYSVGTLWINTLTNTIYVSTNSTAGSAVWTAVNGSGHAQNTDTGTNSTTFTINNANSASDVSLSFGGTSPQNLTWNNVDLRFDLSNDLNVNGDLNVTGLSILLNGAAVGKSTANTTLDVSGDLALNKTEYSISNDTSAINNMDIGSSSFIRMTGNNRTFTVSGFTGGVDGRILILYNDTGRNVTIVNDATSTAENRIFTNTGGNLKASTGNSVYMFIYDAAEARWILVNYVL